MKPKMRHFVALIVYAVVFIAPAGALNMYYQDFESLNQADANALSGDGWLVFANVFSPGAVPGFLYSYGAFPAPNGGAAFSAIESGQGDTEQGAKQLSVYSDYNNADHIIGNLIEANVFQELLIEPGDVGSTWVFSFDAKRGNMAPPSTGAAFIKTFDPPLFTMTNFISFDTSALPVNWARYDLSIDIDGSLSGQILQFGFLNTATNNEGSGIFFDNISFNELSAKPSLLPSTAPSLSPSTSSKTSKGGKKQSKEPKAGKKNLFKKKKKKQGKQEKQGKQGKRI